jgi:thiamine pyrophosphate-dependent acetolactate synthase large subunit-like protein
LEVKLALEIATQVAAGLAILADEALTSEHPYYHYHLCTDDYLSVPGGAIGGMIPVGIGAAVACPDLKLFVWKETIAPPITSANAF